MSPGACPQDIQDGVGRKVVHVDGRRVQMGVSEGALNNPEVRSFVGKRGGEAMPQTMGVNPLFDACPLG
jgi:hypothetical protein